MFKPANPIYVFWGVLLIPAIFCGGLVAMSGAQGPVQGWSLIIPLVVVSLGLSTFAYMTSNAMAYGSNGPSSARVELIRRGLAIAISTTLLGVLIGGPSLLAIKGSDSLGQVLLVAIPMVFVVFAKLRRQLKLFNQLYKKTVPHDSSPSDRL